MANTKSEIQRELEKEIWDKKVVARNARHRKRGSRSTKCSLPSDGMTNKQWKERNSEVMEYNLSKPMKWKVFKFMPKDLQKQYLEKLVNEHHGTQKEIADMFGIIANTLWAYCKGQGFGKVFHQGTFSGHPAWQEFLMQEERDQPAPEDEQPISEPAPPHIEDQPTASKKSAMSCKASFNLLFEGPFDWYSVMDQLTRYVKDGETVQLTICGAVQLTDGDD